MPALVGTRRPPILRAAQLPFDPRPGASLWLPVDMFAGANNDAIGQVDDWSGNGYNVTQSTGGNKPTLKTAANGINGRNAALFDGGDWIENTGLTLLNGATAFTMMYVGTVDTSSNMGVVWNNGGKWRIQYYNNCLYVGAGNGGYGHFTFTNTNPHLITLIYDGSGSGDSGKLKCWVDGVAQTITFDSTISSTLATSNGITIGATDGHAVPMTTKWGELVIWSSARTTERPTDEAALMTKWGIA